MIRAAVIGMTVTVLAFGASGVTRRDLRNSVVKIFTVYNEYDYYRPWQMKGKSSKTGSGCIIEGKRILTNAHVVADQTFIQVKRAGQPRKYVARVLYVGHECDLAVLSVPDQSFFDNTKPVTIGELPSMQDKVAVYGFPKGGTKIAITEGVVSRVENLFYSHSQAYLLCCQIDAPINSGSSGGPVIAGGKIAGVAFQSHSGENIGYMVPAPLVEHFLADIEDREFDGFPDLGLSIQKMENPDIRARYDMAGNQSGIFVNRVFPRSPGRGVLQPDDIILAVDGNDVANDATVEFREGERTFFEHTVQEKFIGDSVSLDILRDGEVQTVRLELTIPSNAWQLVPRQQYDTAPRYYVYGGLVFVPLTRNFLTTWRNWTKKAPRNLVEYYFSEPEEGREEVVVLCQILSDEANIGYDDQTFSVIDTVNGTAVRNLEGLVHAVEDHDSAFQEFVDTEGNRVVLSARKARERKPDIFQRYRIVFDRSKDLGRE